MEDCRIPDEYFTCHADGLFDLLASELARFANRLDRRARKPSLTLTQPCDGTLWSGLAQEPMIG